MPQLQIVDLGHDESENEGGIMGFLNDLGSRYKEDKDKRTFNKLMGEYQKNIEEEGAYEKLQIDLMKSDIAPTKRLEMQQQLNEMQEGIIKKQKAFTDKIKAQGTIDKEAAKEKERERKKTALRNAGATESQIDLYDAASVGGETKIMGQVLEDISRNKAPQGLVSEDIEDKDRGLTPKERVARQDDRFKIQTPLVSKNNDNLKNLESEELSISLLEELDATGKVGEGLNNLNINPLEGSLIIPKLATKEEQLFVKTVNDFTVKAKDSFGARVTNFELDRFMQRLPTLANSKEGRLLIMKQMKIINKINQLEKKAVQEVFDQYGVRNIDYADAENIARKKIGAEKEALRKQFLDLEQVAKKQEHEMESNLKSRTKEGYTAMRKPDGTIKQFPNKNVPNLEDKGYKKL